MVNFDELRSAQLAKSTLLTSTVVSLGFFRCFNVYSDAKQRMGCGKQRELPHLSIPSKTANLVPKFAMEDISLGRTAALVTEFAVKDLPLG